MLVKIIARWIYSLPNSLEAPAVKKKQMKKKKIKKGEKNKNDPNGS